MGRGLPLGGKPTPPLDPHHPAAGTRFESLTASIRLIRRLTTRQLEEYQLAGTDFWALTWIGGGESGPTALGRRLGVSPASMTQLLDRLERRGLIRRSRNPGDRRATLVALTPEGRRLQRRAEIRCARFLNGVATELSPAGLAALDSVSRELSVILARRVAEPPASMG